MGRVYTGSSFALSAFLKKMQRKVGGIIYRPSPNIGFEYGNQFGGGSGTECIRDIEYVRIKYLSRFRGVNVQMGWLQYS